jgi:hypothetical protein
MTPYEAWYGQQPDVSNLKTFGSRVCVKAPGQRHCKLDCHDYTGIFLGYTATDQNIRYIDTTTGIVKTSHHATFNEAWYLQPTRPPAAQLLYNLGLEADNTPTIPEQPPAPTTTAPWPPMAPPTALDKQWSTTHQHRSLPLLLRVTASPLVLPTAAKTTTPLSHQAYTTNKNLNNKQLAAELVTQYLINGKDLATIYMSPEPYHQAFEEELNLCRFDLSRHKTAGLSFIEHNNRLILATMSPHTPGNRLPRWRTHLRGAWLIKIDDTPIHNIGDAQRMFQQLSDNNATTCVLLFSHPEITCNISNKGLAIMSPTNFTQLTHDQLNNRTNLLQQRTTSPPLPSTDRPYQIVTSGDVLNYSNKAMKLTRGRLLKHDDWSDWQQSEYLQLDQYDGQGMFGAPTQALTNSAIFHLVWTYNIKAADGRKKARCACDGSTRSGHVRILDETYANCIDQTSARLFYAVTAGENMLAFGADVSNAFAEAPPPKQGFFIRPDRAFHEWWTLHKKRPPLPPDYVIPINSAMQGHPKSPRLWEKHADKILRTIGLTPTIHEPCLYTGHVNNQRVILMQQVDDFAIASTDEHTANILLDQIEDHLSIPLKQQGLIDMYNGIDVTQTRDYIKIDCHTYINKFCEKYVDTWLHNTPITEAKPLPLPACPIWLKKFNSAVGSTNPTEQVALAKSMQVNYRAGVGELIWAMTTCRTDIAFASVKLSQSNSNPHEHHYHGLKHTIKYLYTTRTDGIYYWHTTPGPDLQEGPPPSINSNATDLLLNQHKHHQPLIAVAYADSDWATCIKTRRSFTGVCIFLSGGVIAYKTKFQPTVALLSTKAEFMAACDAGQMCLFI